MAKKIRASDLPEFDIAEHRGSEQAMAETLTVVLAESDPAALAGALGSMARAHGMSEIAKASGVDAFLQEEVRRRYRAKWLAENREAVAEYNERFKQDDVFSDGLRSS